MNPINTAALESIKKHPGNYKSFWSKFRYFSGLGFLVAVGYMDPGNWATDIEAGSKFGYALLWVVLLASLIAILLQTLCVRLGVASKRDLAELCRERFNKKINFILWLFAEIAIIACDFAEILGTALALKLLFGLPLLYGILLTALDTFVILVMHGRKILNLERIVMLLVLIITASFVTEIFFSTPEWHKVGAGFIPKGNIFSSSETWLIAIGIFGATVMPHNLYLHTSIVKHREVDPSAGGRKEAIGFLTLDTLVTLAVAFVINAAILILAASAFHFSGNSDVKEIDDAYRLLVPITGTVAASIIFAIALFAAGQSSTFTGTLAGQAIFEGFLNLKMPRWKQRLLTRSLALIPAWFLVAIMGEGSLGRLLVYSQVILSMQLPFALVPLIIFNNSREIMGEWRISKPLLALSGLIALGIIGANIYLLIRLIH